MKTQKNEDMTNYPECIFPFVHENGLVSKGPSLWDFFAAHALNSLLVHVRYYERDASSPPVKKMVCRIAADYASSMIDERVKRMKGKK